MDIEDTYKRKRIYIETTIPSYLAAYISRDILQAARQQLTHEWWNSQRHHYDLCLSQIVLDEMAAGDEDAAQRRMTIIVDLPLLDITTQVDELAQKIMKSRLLPERASRDAIHIAIACVHKVDFLLTWNCKHIANAGILRDLSHIVVEAGHEMPIICTPEELIGD